MLKVVRHLDTLKTETAPVVLAIGFFDGVHLGHRAVIEAARAQAEKLAAELWILTFEPHPRKVISPETAPALLTATRHKLHIFEQMNVQGCILMPFAPAFRHLTASEFLEMLTEAIPTLRHIVVGSNWTFGHKGTGTADVLKQWALAHGIETSTVAPVTYDGEPVSSTRIRKAVAGGNLKDASAMLGQPFSIWGTVVRGRGIGRTMGFPTANIRPHNEVFPPEGIYAVTAEIGEGIFHGAGYIGRRPTFTQAGNEWSLEVFFFDLRENIYDREIIVRFAERIRSDRKFDTPAELTRQIEDDVRRAKSILSEQM
ncbi:MAG TPA: bifunctional riboflavin kinase/FAD synthetase [Kiritimatiellia bacterium]|nr:bifunctional riboflavin kinase/FAD synthetase [Kiritimatiellia bacterium]HNS80976.1 bifunctional riboflavin kinase/FAD synthetase [Kiritimatiellia bacterium]HPA77862.1 bifunctional riboflavin kinase/FAD synthetase [Kiritimatiellia bacterium]HQQ04266.1 bifunctional riboflavin kinase/FAD synthetase [Kiritimatiellia bacterium]